jgi:Flp pilus assembly protein TadG
MMKNLSEKGQAIVMVAFAVIGLVAFAALAIDGGRLFSDKRHAQNAADSAALAVALALTRSPTGQDDAYYFAVAEDAAEKSAAINGYDDNEVTNDVRIKLTETDKATKECNGAYHGTDAQVTIVSTIDTTLARVIGRNQLSNTVTAYARFCHAVIDINTGTVLQQPTVEILK